LRGNVGCLCLSVNGAVVITNAAVSTRLVGVSNRDCYDSF
jgi:hypothetical protein